MVLNALNIILSPNIDDKLFNHSDNFVKNFVKNFKEIYGSKYISHIVHSLIHISKDYNRFGPLDSFSCKFDTLI